MDKAASWYGVQTKFTFDAASTGLLTAVVRDGSGAYGSTIQVTDHGSGPKSSDIDRLDHYLTQMDGTTTTHFNPAALI